MFDLKVSDFTIKKNSKILKSCIQKKGPENFPSPHVLAVCMQGEGGSLSFFSKASCTVHGFA